MITFIIGKRNSAYETALAKAVGNLAAEKKTVSAETLNMVFDEVQTPSLFGDKKVFIISGMDDEAVRETLLDRGAELADAPHDVIVVADALLAAETKKVEKFGTIVKVVEKKELVREAFNPFALANAFATGDRKKTWIAYQQVRAQSDEAEPLHGMIWWKLKDMLAKKQIAHADAQQTARALVAAYHESRMGGLSLGERLELFFLNQ